MELSTLCNAVFIIIYIVFYIKAIIVSSIWTLPGVAVSEILYLISYQGEIFNLPAKSHIGDHYLNGPPINNEIQM